MRVTGVILVLGNMTLPQRSNKAHHCTLQQSIFVYCHWNIFSNLLLLRDPRKNSINSCEIFIHQKMIATKQIENRRNEKLYSGHNIENKVTYVT